MAVIPRLLAAVRAFADKPARNELPLQEQGRAPFLISLGLNNLDVNPIKTKRDQLDNYTGWVYGCVQTLSQDFRTAPWGQWKKAGKKRGDWKQVPDEKVHPIFQRPNSRQTWGQFKELRTLHKDTTGEAYWHFLTTKPGGTILGVELIQPDQVEEPILSPDKKTIEAWRISIAGRTQDPIPAADLFPDFYQNPRDPLRGASPIEAFALGHHMDLYLRAYGVKLVRDGAFITQAIETEQDITSEQAETIADRVQRRAKTPGRIHVFGKGAKITTPGLPLRDLDFIRMLKPSQELILGIYHMPKSKFGIVEGAGDANQKVADKTYQENALLPRFVTFDEIINVVMGPRLQGFEGMAYETESPVEVDQEWEFEKAEKLFKDGATTRKVFLMSTGNGDLVTDEDDVRYIPTNVTVVKVGEDPNAEATPPQQQPAETPPADPAAKDATIDGVLARIEVEALTREVSRQRLKAASERFLRKEEALERTAKSELRKTFSSEQRSVVASVKENSANLKALAEDWDAYQVEVKGHLTLLGSDSFQELELGDKLRIIGDEPSVWRRDWLDKIIGSTEDTWRQVIADVIDRGTRTGWSLLSEEVIGALSFSIFEQKALEFAQRQAGKKVVGIQRATMEEIRKVISAGVQNGDSIDSIARNVSELYNGFKGVRSETIARTETANAMNFGKYSNAKESSRKLGLTLKRTWSAVEDERTRESHRAADGQTIELDGHYIVEGVEMKFPGDPSAPAELVINCRCSELIQDAGT